MKEKYIAELDSMFEAFSVIAEGAYVYVCDIEHDYSRWSETAVECFGLPSEYMNNAGELWVEYIHPDDRKGYLKSIDGIFENENSQGHDMQYRAKTSDGNYVVCSCRGVIIRDSSGKPKYFGGVIRNHGDLSFIDAVTGLRSLYGFFDDLKVTFSKKIKSLILMIGISGFSDINDIYGYTFGNRVLQEFGRKLKSKFADYGVVYRLDGTRFAIIANGLSEETARSIYEELQAENRKSFCVDSEKINVSLNAGAICVDYFDIALETFYSCLRYSYYESKHHRLGELVMFDNTVSDYDRKSIERLNTIRNSVADGCKGFFLCYQPIMDAETEELRGMEALIRWKNDEYGVVPPIYFIPILEQDTLFPELGKWILRQAMSDGKKFLEMYPDFVMNVNLSYTQLEKSNFVSDVFNIIYETGFPAQNLCLEITERCRLLDISLLKDMFVVFKDKGVKVALDDFGTGFSSLGILRSIPVDTVKIDREFVKDVEKSSADQNTIKFISELADAFEADVCVEGIETSEMRDFMRKYRVSKLQGYYYSKPITAEEILRKKFG